MACQVKGEDRKKREQGRTAGSEKTAASISDRTAVAGDRAAISEKIRFGRCGDRNRDNHRKSYERYLEQKTEEALQCVEGVGNVKVMITLKSSEENVVEKDQQSDGQSVEEEDSQGGKRMTKETSSDKTSIYEQKSDGTQVPYVSKKLSPEVEGVIVIADGGDNAVVVQNITGAIQALYGVEAHKIKVMKRNVAGTE